MLVSKWEDVAMSFDNPLPLTFKTTELQRQWIQILQFLFSFLELEVLFPAIKTNLKIRHEYNYDRWFTTNK